MEVRTKMKTFVLRESTEPLPLYAIATIEANDIREAAKVLGAKLMPGGSETTSLIVFSGQEMLADSRWEREEKVEMEYLIVFTRRDNPELKIRINKYTDNNAYSCCLEQIPKLS